MSINCHNSGKLPWNLLADAFSCATYDNIKFIWKIEDKKLKHFCSVFENVLQDFSKTYKKEVRYELNPIAWEYGDYSSGMSEIGYHDSLLMIYIRLNLILLGSKLDKNSSLSDETSVYDVCSGSGSFHLDEYIESKFVQIKNKLFQELPVENFWEEKYKFNTLTRELIIEIRSYLKEVYECLIRMYQSESHKNYFTSDNIFDTIKWDLESNTRN